MTKDRSLDPHILRRNRTIDNPGRGTRVKFRAIRGALPAQIGLRA
ncbi:hypothetical protein [Rhizobium sp. GR12]